jgi:hypothetical protein
MKSKRFLNKGRAYSYNSIMNWIKFSNLWQKFEKETNSGIIYLDDVNIDTYYGFMNFCDSHNYKESSKYLYCTIFKTVLNYSYYDGITVNCISRNRNFITHCSTSNIKHTYLNKNEIEKIYSSYRKISIEKHLFHINRMGVLTPTLFFHFLTIP